MCFNIVQLFITYQQLYRLTLLRRNGTVYQLVQNRRISSRRMERLSNRILQTAKNLAVR